MSLIRDNSFVIYTDQDAMSSEDSRVVAMAVDPFGLFHPGSAAEEVRIARAQNLRAATCGGSVPWDQLPWLLSHDSDIIDAVQAAWKMFRAGASSTLIHADGRFAQWREKANAQCNICAACDFDLTMNQLLEQFEYGTIDYICECCVLRAVIENKLADIEQASGAILRDLADLEDEAVADEQASRASASARGLSHQTLAIRIAQHNKQRAVYSLVRFWFHLRDADDVDRTCATLVAALNALKPDGAHYLKHTLKCPALVDMLNGIDVSNTDATFQVYKMAKRVDIAIDELSDEYLTKVLNASHEIHVTELMHKIVQVCATGRLSSRDSAYSTASPQDGAPLFVDACHAVRDATTRCAELAHAMCKALHSGDMQQAGQVKQPYVKATLNLMARSAEAIQCLDCVFNKQELMSVDNMSTDSEADGSRLKKFAASFWKR